MNERKQALKQHLTVKMKDIKESSYNECTFEVEGMEFLVLTDEEADEIYDESIENYIEDCILPEIPEELQRYFDEEAFKRDAKMDGRAHYLAGYDGCEYWEDVNGTTYYIYRTN